MIIFFWGQIYYTNSDYIKFFKYNLKDCTPATDVIDGL
jgi:hypothetical protein